VISEIIEYDVYDTYVPTRHDIVLAAIQLIEVKVKGVYHQVFTCDDSLAAKQQRSFFAEIFTHSPLGVHDVVSLYNVEQTLLLTLNP
jgi:hypothetical protein